MQRVQWMQRFMLVLTSGPKSLSWTARLFSSNPPRPRMARGREASSSPPAPRPLCRRSSALACSGRLPLTDGCAAVFGDTPLHLRAEVADQSLNGPSGAISQRANRMALDLVGDVQ